jgi:hypothetical protein
MKIDDIAADLIARNASYVAALSTTPVPLSTITAAQVFTRDYQEPTGKACVFLDPKPEEVIETSPSYSIVRLPVELTVFTQGAREYVLRSQASQYARALHNCLRANPYYAEFTGREDYDGVEAKSDIKATKMSLIFIYEEAT